MMATEKINNRIDAVDRLNDVCSVVGFLGETVQSLLRKEHGMDDERRYGANLIFAWVEGQVREVHDFLDGQKQPAQ